MTKNGEHPYMTKKIFEFIVLDLFQAGLNWETILKKRKGFKKAFSNFDPKKISKYSDNKIKN